MPRSHPHFSDLTPIETACLAFACAEAVIMVFIGVGGAVLVVAREFMKAAGFQ